MPQHLGRRRDETPRHIVCLKRRKEGEIGAPAERKSTNRRRRREAAVEAEVGEAAVRSDGFVFLHNGGAKRPQTVGLWGVFPSSPRDVLPCKFLSFFFFTFWIRNGNNSRESLPFSRFDAPKNEPAFLRPCSRSARKSSRERRFDRRRRVDGPRYPSRARVAIRRETIGRSGGKSALSPAAPFSR